MRFVDGDRLGQLGRRAEETAEFQLEVEPFAGRERGRFGFGKGVLEDLTLGADDGRAADDDARRASVVRDGEVAVVGGERVAFAAEDGAAVARVVQACEEVGVVADGHGEVRGCLREGDEAFVADGGVVT